MSTRVSLRRVPQAVQGLKMKSVKREPELLISARLDRNDSDALADPILFLH
jgi:hypothetical protein